MARMKGLFSVCAIVMAATLTVSCQDGLEDNEQYKIPDWLKGSAYEVLQSEGNHSMFLEGIDLTGYRPIVDGKSILTVMAPDDNAFSNFLNEYGYSSVADMNEKNPALLKKTIGFHLMYYAYNWDKLVNFRPNEGDGATDDEKAVNAGMYYKHRTRSSDDIEKTRVKLTSSATTDTLISIDHDTKCIRAFA